MNTNVVVREVRAPRRVVDLGHVARDAFACGVHGTETSGRAPLLVIYLRGRGSVEPGRDRSMAAQAFRLVMKYRSLDRAVRVVAGRAPKLVLPGGVTSAE